MFPKLFICKDYARKDPRITYFRQEKNIGMFPNFKFLIDQAQGGYFMWAGQDDLWDKDFLKVCVAVCASLKKSQMQTNNPIPQLINFNSSTISQLFQ